MFVDIKSHSPNNFTLTETKNSQLLYNNWNVYNDDSDIPMQKYMFLLKNVKVLNNTNNILNIIMTSNNDMNKKIYEFMVQLEKQIGIKLKDLQCRSNIHKIKSNITMCLYSKKMIVFNEAHEEQHISQIDSGKTVSIIIKLSQIVCEESEYIPIWKVVQVKLHNDKTKTCMFEQFESESKIPIPPVLPFTKTCKQEVKDEKPVQRPFVPSIGDIMSIKNKLRKIPSQVDGEQKQIVPKEKRKKKMKN